MKILLHKLETEEMTIGYLPYTHESFSFPKGTQLPSFIDLPDNNNQVFSPEKHSFIDCILFLTSDCNFRCKYCYENISISKKSQFMSKSTAKTILSWLSKKGPLRISFFGGEPFVAYETMLYVAEYATLLDSNSKLSITTNGGYLPSMLEDFLLPFDISVLFSFDGPPEIQNKNRPMINNKESFDYVFANIKRIYAIKPKKIAFRATVQPEDIYKLREIVYFFRDNFPLSRLHIELASGIDISNELVEYFYLTLVDLFFESLKKGLILTNQYIRMEPKSLTNSFCSATSGNRLVFVPNGNIYGCHRINLDSPDSMNDFLLGKIIDNTISLDKDKILSFDKNKFLSDEDCLNCIAVRFCRGGCPWESLYHRNTIYSTKSKYCKFIKKASIKMISLGSSNPSLFFKNIK